MGVNEDKDGVQTRNLWVNYHLELLEEEGKQKEPEKEQPRVGGKPGKVDSEKSTKESFSRRRQWPSMSDAIDRLSK